MRCETNWDHALHLLPPGGFDPGRELTGKQLELVEGVDHDAVVEWERGTRQSPNPPPGLFLRLGHSRASSSVLFRSNSC